MKIIKLVPLKNYKLQIEFDDGISGIIDLTGFIDNGIFKILKEDDNFNKVFTNGYSVAWSDELEIDALAIYSELSDKSPEELFSISLNYAAN